MSFTIYDMQTDYNKRGKPSLIRLSTYGHIRFSKAAVALLGLKKGMLIAFMTDHRDKGVIYFFQNKNGLSLKPCMNGKRSEGLQICCRQLSNKLLKFFGYTDHKSFDLKEGTAHVNGENAWIILKENIHRPVKWKKKS